MKRSVEDIFNDCLDLRDAARQAYLDEVCGDDRPLRDEVEALLRAYEDSAELDLPEFALSGHPPARVGSYTILGELGRGSMGIVYRARDETLARELAIKVLPANLALLQDWVGRFEAEARTLASLKHPNIATIYSFEESQGQRFITMELVEGPTLDERLRAAPPSPAEALRLTLQIARGLEAAHARGVIHRDLKPLNIRVDRSGTAKLLDFGIAKSVADLGFDADQPTWIAPDAGRSSLPAGTPGFMSPEQAAGRAVDQRADIWAFGRILQACFPAPGSSRRIRDLIDSCLQEDLDARLGSMAEARGIIEQELHRRHPTPYRAGLVGIALVLAILLIVAFLKGRGEEAPASDPFRNTRRTQVTFSGVASWPEIAPAGDRLAYVSTPVPTRNQVLVQEIGSGHAEQVFESRSTPRMRWSPEGDRLLVAGNLDGEHRLYLVDASTRPNAAPADRILAVFPYAAPMAWSPDGRRFAAALSYGRRDSLVIATPSGDRVRTCAPPGGEALRGLDWSHDGKWLAVETQGEGQSRLWCGPADGTSWRPVVEQQGVSNPRWAHDDRAIYYLDDLDARLHAVPIDHRTGRGGSGRLVDAGPFNNGFGFSRTGTLVFARGPGQSNIRLVDLTEDPISDRPITTGTFAHGAARFSPDGHFVVYVRSSQGRSSDLLVHELATGRSRLLLNETGITIPAWSPDGREILFASLGPVERRLLRVNVDTGTTSDVPALDFGNLVAWSPGRSILIQSEDAHGYWILDPDSAGQRPLLPEHDRGYLWQLEVSPGGDRVAVLETESKDSEGPRVLLVSLADGSVSTLYRGLAAPICWSEDERFVYLITDRPSPENLGSGEPGSLNVSPRPGTVVPDDARATPSPRYQSSESPRAQILAVPLDGGPPRTLASLSHRGGMWSAVDMTPDGRWLVYDADDFVSDVWLVEPLPGTTP